MNPLRSFYLLTILFIALGPLHPLSKELSFKYGLLTARLRRKPWEAVLEEGGFLHDPLGELEAGAA